MTDTSHQLHTDHSRNYQANKFVYPVLSRRSRGISIGVNLNPDKICNFDCVYCQVDRRTEAETRFVETERLLSEIDAMLALVTSGAIYGDEPFATVPESLRRLNDIAFSGDGEPTTYRNIDAIIGEVAALKSQHGLDTVKLVLITNASMFHRPACRKALEILDRNQGEIWAKLDAGTEDYFQRVERTKIPFQRILDNITEAARKRPLVLQSLFLRLEGKPPSAEEIDAYCERIGQIQRDGGKIKLVQIYTVARRPAEDYVTPLTDEEVDAIAEKVHTSTGVTAECFYGQ